MKFNLGYTVHYLMLIVLILYLATNSITFKCYLAIAEGVLFSIFCIFTDLNDLDDKH